MDNDTYLKMREGFRKSMQMYPNCSIANCGCDSNHGEWKENCHCMCHFKMMDKIFGEEKWNLNEFSEMSHKGLTPKEYNKRMEKG